jgi:hypothetical protein
LAAYTGPSGNLHRRNARPLHFQVLAAAEHQVLEQMRETSLSRKFFRRPCVISDFGRDDRSLGFFMYRSGQSIK